jgi:hypothetical protein
VDVEDSERCMERGISKRSSRSDEERDGPNRPSAVVSIRSPELWGWSAGNVQVARLKHGSSGGVREGGLNVHGGLSRQRLKDRDI